MFHLGLGCIGDKEGVHETIGGDKEEVHETIGDDKRQQGMLKGQQWATKDIWEHWGMMGDDKKCQEYQWTRWYDKGMLVDIKG